MLGHSPSSSLTFGPPAASTALSLRERTNTFVDSNPLSPQKNHLKRWLFYWLGWLDSNQRMTGSKPVALPLGDTPILLLLITYIGFICKLFLFYGALGEIRTHDLRLRRATLYPAELQAHCLLPSKRFSPFIRTKRASLYTASSENASFLCRRFI